MIPATGMLIHESKSYFVLRDITKVTELFAEHVATIEVPPQGLMTVIYKDCYQAACNHIMYSPSQLSGRCDICGGAVCSSCFVRCHECARSLCPDHLVINEDKVVCQGCASKIKFVRFGIKALRYTYRELTET